jgi:hypothetical protein
MDLAISSDLVFGDINLAFVCQRVVAFFSRADTDYILDGADEDGPITLVAGGSCLLDDLHHLFNIVFTYNEIHLNAGQSVDNIGAVPSGQLDTALTAVPLNFDSIDSGDTDFNQSQPDIVQFLISDVRFDLFEHHHFSCVSKEALAIHAG